MLILFNFFNESKCVKLFKSQFTTFQNYFNNAFYDSNGPVAKYGSRRQPAELKTVGSNPTGPALVLVSVEGREKLNKRKEIVEHPFGTIKRASTKATFSSGGLERSKERLD